MTTNLLILFHFIVDGAVAGKGLATFFVSAQCTDQIGILDFPVEIADKGPPRQVRRGNLIQYPLLLLAGRRVDDRNQSL